MPSASFKHLLSVGVESDIAEVAPGRAVERDKEEEAGPSSSLSSLGRPVNKQNRGEGRKTKTVIFKLVRNNKSLLSSERVSISINSIPVKALFKTLNTNHSKAFWIFQELCDFSSGSPDAFQHETGLVEGTPKVNAVSFSWIAAASLPSSLSHTLYSPFLFLIWHPTSLL